MTIFGLFWCKFVLQFWDYHFFCSNKNFTIFFVPTKNGILPFFLFQKHTPPQISPHTAQNAVAHAHTNAYEHQSMHIHSRFSHNTHTTTLKHTRRAPQCLHRNKLKKLSKTKRHSSTPALTKPPFAPHTHSRMQIMKFHIYWKCGRKKNAVLGKIFL